MPELKCPLQRLFPEGLSSLIQDRAFRDRANISSFQMSCFCWKKTAQLELPWRSFYTVETEKHQKWKGWASWDPPTSPIICPFLPLYLPFPNSFSSLLFFQPAEFWAYLQSRWEGDAHFHIFFLHCKKWAFTVSPNAVLSKVIAADFDKSLFQPPSKALLPFRMWDVIGIREPSFPDGSR